MRPGGLAAEGEIVGIGSLAAALFLQSNYPNAPIVAKAAVTAVAKPVTVAPAIRPIVVPAQPVAAPPQWRDRLAALLRNDAKPVAKSRISALLFFSFIRRNQQNVLQPGVVYASVVPPELWHDLRVGTALVWHPFSAAKMSSRVAP